MEKTYLEELFFSLSECKKKEDELKNKITEEISKNKRSEKIYGVIATYYKESEELDYENSAKRKIDKDFDFDKYTTTVKIIKWKEICSDLSIDVDSEKKPARVVIRYDNKSTN